LFLPRACIFWINLSSAREKHELRYKGRAAIANRIEIKHELRDKGRAAIANWIEILLPKLLPYGFADKVLGPPSLGKYEVAWSSRLFLFLGLAEEKGRKRIYRTHRSICLQE